MRSVTPEVYDLAFSYRDYGNEVDHMEYNWQKASETDCQRILDIACGTGRHLEQFNLRGYECAGIDLNSEMVAFCRKKFADIKPPVTFYEADMRKFELEERFGLAINMLTSANLIVKNQEMVSHLRSVAKVLEPGGIYILEMFHPREHGYNAMIPARSWEVIKDDCTVQADIMHRREEFNPLDQKQSTTLKVTVITDGDEQVYRLDQEHRVYLYLEFLSLVDNAGGFEPVVCYGTFNSSVVMDNSRRSWRMIHVLRRNADTIG